MDNWVPFRSTGRDLVVSNSNYLALVADKLQSSLVQIFGDPTDTTSNANVRFLATNLTNTSSDTNSYNQLIHSMANNSITNSNFTDALFNNSIISNHSTEFGGSVNETVCWKECTILYPLTAINQIDSETRFARNRIENITNNDNGNSTICWDKCIDVAPKSDDENDTCYNECLTMDPTVEKNNTTSSSITTPRLANATNSTHQSDSVIFFNSTSNITGSNISGIFFDEAGNTTKDIVDETVNSHQYDVVCWKECPILSPTMPPTLAPTFRPFVDILKDAQNSTSEMDEQEWNPDNLSDGEILQQTLELYGTIFIIGLVTFCIARKMYPRPFNLRSGWVSEDVITPNPRAKNPEALGWISWIWKIWLISDTELSDECGMDALCLSRVLEWGVRITAFGSLVGCIILMPVYATAGGVHDGERGIERLNTSNVPDGNDGRFVATVVAAYLIFGFVMYTTLDEFEWFYKFRYQFLCRPLPRNYVVYVRNLERENRTRKALIEYFSHFEDPNLGRSEEEERIGLLFNNNNSSSNNDAPTKAWVALKIPHLQKLVGKRASVLSKLEHHINIQDVCNTYPKTRCETSGAVITVVDALFQELKDLNAEIKVAIERIETRARLEDPHEYDAQDYQNPYQVDESPRGDFTGGHENEDADRTLFFDTIALSQSIDNNDVGEDKSASMYKSAKEPSRELVDEDYLYAAEELGKSMDEQESLTIEQHTGRTLNSANSTVTDVDPEAKPKSGSHLGRLTGMVRTSMAMVGNQVEKVGKEVGTAAKVVGKQVAGTAADVVGTTAHVVAGQAANVANVMGNLIGSKDDDGAPMTAGFVAFSSLKACQAAKQMSHSNDVFGMEVFEAPGFDDILWHNVGKAHKELQMGLLLSFVLTTTLCLFWTVVTTFIATLSSVQGLTQIVPFIEVWLEKAPWLEMVLAQISPLMIVLADELLKVILEILSKLEGPVSGMAVEASLFTKISVFKIIQTFFVNAVSGSLVSQLSAISVIAKDPSAVVTLLANALPNRSAFFIQILLVDTFISLSMELLRVSAIAIAIVRSFVGPKLTEDERRTTWMGLRPLADPYEFRYAEILGGSVLYYVVFFVYCTLSPITSVFMFICFLIMGAAYRHQFIFIYPTLPDSGGKLWIQFMKVVPTSLFIAEFTISGFLAAKSAPVASALMIPLIGLTILFNMYIRQKHFGATDYLPGCRCIEEDRKNNIDGPMDLRFISNYYMQPELRDKEVYPSNASLALQLKHGMIESPELA